MFPPLSRLVLHIGHTSWEAISCLGVTFRQQYFPSKYMPQESNYYYQTIKQS